MSGGGGTQTQVQKADPWSAAVPYLTGGKVGGQAPARSGLNIIQGRNDPNDPSTWTTMAGPSGGTDVPGVLPESARIYSEQAGGGPYSGDLVARPTAATLGSQQEALDIAGGIRPQGQAIQQYASDVLSGQYLTPESNPALQDYIRSAIRPLQENLTENVLPNIRSGAIQAGAFGGSRQGIAETGATREFLRGAGDITSQIATRAYEQERKAQALAPQLMQQGIQTELLAPQVQGQVGQQQQQQQQQLIDEAFQQYQMGQDYPWDVLGRYANIVLPASGQGGTTVGTKSGGANPLGGALGGLGTAAGLGSLMAAPSATGLAAVGGLPLLASGAALGYFLS